MMKNLSFDINLGFSFLTPTMFSKPNFELDYVTMGIIVYAFTCFCEIFTTVLQHRAQFKKTTKEMKDVMSEEKINEGSAYAMAKAKFKIVDVVYSFAKDAIVYIYIQRIYGFLLSKKLNADVLLFIVMFAIDKVVKVPLALFFDFALEASFGYNKKTFGTWLYDFFASFVVISLLLWPVYGGAIYLIKRFNNFYFQITLFITVFKFAMIWAYPMVIAPIFNRFELFDEERPLFKKIQDLASKIGFSVTSIYVMDGSKRSGHSNAYFVGFGKQKRVVFYDTLLEQLKDDDQILAVIAHEFGHFKRGHLYWYLVIDTIGLFGALYIMNIFFKANILPVGLNLFLFMTLMTPLGYVFSFIRNFFIRMMEKDADNFAVNMGYAEKLTESLKILATENTSTLKNSYVYSLVNDSHPPIMERVQFLNNKLEAKEKKEK